MNRKKILWRDCHPFVNSSLLESQSMVYEIPTSHIGSDKINIDFLINLKSYIYRRKDSITIFVEAYYAKFEIGRVVA